MNEEDPLSLPDEREGSFYSTLLLVLAAHVVAIALIWLVGGMKKKHEEIVWLSGDGLEGSQGAPAAPAASAMAPATRHTAPAQAEPPVEKPEASLPPIPDDPPPPPPSPRPTPPPARPEPSDMAERKPTPPPTPKPTPKPPEPKPKPRPEPEPTPKPKPVAVERKTTPPPKPKPPTPEPTKVAKADPKPAVKATVNEQAKAALAKTEKTSEKPATGASTTPAKVTREGASGSGEVASNANSGTGKSAAPGPSRDALRGTYGSIVGGRFKTTGEPRKPTSAVGDNREYSTLMRFKIARDGSVLSVFVVTPSGNPLVDSWIHATIPDFQRVPPPPVELLKDGVYEDSMEVIYEL